MDFINKVHPVGALPSPVLLPSLDKLKCIRHQLVLLLKTEGKVNRYKGIEKLYLLLRKLQYQ